MTSAIGSFVELGRAFVAARLFVAASFCCLLAGGCATPIPSSFDDSHAVPPLVLRLQPGDEIEISFFGAPDLNSKQAIRSDGKISLSLTKDVAAAGLTPDELEDSLKSIYATQLQIKDVNVILRTPPPVLVSGAVLKPGRVVLGRPLTVLDAIMESGGFNTKEAEVRSVVLIRHEDGKRTGYTFDFQRALAGEGEDRSFYVKPFDIVYVPRTFISRANTWVDQHINKMLPDLGLSYNEEEGATVYR